MPSLLGAGGDNLPLIQAWPVCKPCSLQSRGNGAAARGNLCPEGKGSIKDLFSKAVTSTNSEHTRNVFDCHFNQGTLDCFLNHFQYCKSFSALHWTTTNLF